jgi:hypothetical protein
VLLIVFWDSTAGLIVFVTARGFGASPFQTLMAASAAMMIRAIVMSVRSWTATRMALPSRKLNFER